MEAGKVGTGYSGGHNIAGDYSSDGIGGGTKYVVAKQEGLGYEKDVGAGKAGSSGGDNIAGDYSGDGLGIHGVAENGVARGMIRPKQRKGKAI
ncbi:hypothetical protein ES708_06265 [subsurface metagenome]